MRVAASGMKAAKLWSVLQALLQNPATERVFPFPLSSGHAFDLGHAEFVEAVHESDTDVDFGGLAVAVS